MCEKETKKEAIYQLLFTCYETKMFLALNKHKGTYTSLSNLYPCLLDKIVCISTAMVTATSAEHKSIRHMLQSEKKKNY